MQHRASERTLTARCSLRQINSMTPIERARRALLELIGDGPQAARVNAALKCLKPLRSVVGFDTTIIEMLNDACDTNCLPKERAEIVAHAIENIFRMCGEVKSAAP